MGIIVGLISISLILAVGFLASFIWSLKSGQYDDTYSPSVRMLFDDKSPVKPVEKSEVKESTKVEDQITEAKDNETLG